MLLRFFIFIFLTTQLCNAQNLVYNGSFEEITQCNTTNFLYNDYVVGWVNPCQTNGHSSDYYNITCPPLPNLSKMPYHGNALFGLATYSSTQTYPSGITNFHEFVRGTLVTPLNVGSTYCVSFKVSPLSPSFVSDKIGALFTNVEYNSSNPYEALTNYAHVFSNTVITDTSWTTVSGSFVADSAYRYIMLGNFFADNLTSHVSGGAYYWIDDVRVVLDPNGDCSAIHDTTTTPSDTVYHVSQNLTICAGETITLPGGTVVNTSGIYTDTLLAANGADSIVTTTLDVLPYLTDTISASICHGGHYNFGGNLLTASGTYTDTLTAVSTSCDSILVLNLNVLPAIPLTEIFDTICAGSTYLFNGSSLTAPGTYTANITSLQGCDSVITLNLAVINPPNRPEVVTNLPVPCYNQEFTGEILNPNTALTYRWYVDTNGTAAGQGEKFTKIIDENTVTIYVSADNGTCSSAFTIIPITVNQLFNANFEMPNVITPNNDGANDEIDFEAIFGGCIEYEISIFNRWGNLVFKNGAVFNGKDSKGHNLVDGTYFYKLTYEGIQRHGFIHLLR
ncbi:MAG: gliding motility-associated C-terminal domain-containing protein [Flavobacteriia bacterium]|nr:gliding motility-associated C-terminal domain-containing protein [Flavobacteriia bacterium]OJX36230.1 MAG: hypothetical protein BGO87_07145 [Flavobacteriia bacterium 40-80]